MYFNWRQNLETLKLRAISNIVRGRGGADGCDSLATRTWVEYECLVKRLRKFWPGFFGVKETRNSKPIANKQA